MAQLNLNLVKAFTAIMFLAFAREPATYAASSDWDHVITAAKRESKLSLIGPPGSEVPAALTNGFQKKYPEIQAEFNGLTTQQATARLPMSLPPASIRPIFSLPARRQLWIYPSETLGNEMIAKGLPLKQMDPELLREST